MATAPLIKHLLARQQLYMGYLMAMTRDPAAAEEVFQDVAVALIGSTRDEAIRDEHAWVKEVVRRQALRWVRERRRDRQRARELDPELAAEIDRAFAEDQVADGAPQRELAALQSCLREVPEKNRAVLALRYERKASFEEIAEATASTAGAVQRLVSRLRVALRACIERRLALADAGGAP